MSDVLSVLAELNRVAAAINTATQPAQEPTHRIEWTGRIKVYQPIRPTVHQATTEAAVMCA